MLKNNTPSPKVALITGAARRIGAEISNILQQNGYNVVLHYNNSQTEAEELCSKLNSNRQDSAITMKANLANHDDLKSLVENSAQHWGNLDVLINNASCFYKSLVGEVTEDVWNDLINTNLKAPFFLSQAAVPFLKQTKGTIINIVDIHAKRPMLEYPVYSIAKSGLKMLTKTLARELGPDIKVNSVSPGAIMWPEGENTLTKDIKDKIISHTALKCHGDANAIAKAVLFLVKDARYITGQDIAVDGGRSLYL